MIYKYKYYIKKIFLSLRKWRRIDIGKDSIIERKSVVDPGEYGKIIIGDNCFIHQYGILKCYDRGVIKIGNNVSVNPYCVLYGIGDLNIGNNVRIAAHTVFIPANHNFSDITTPIYKQGITAVGIKIDDDVWIGANVTILDNVRIGTHSVIGAGSVVNRDIPAYTMAAGSPCKIIKKLKS